MLSADSIETYGYGNSKGLVSDIFITKFCSSVPKNARLSS